jgi:HPt (histidine-containing phosphotransfer) domain-containing protein
MNEKIVVQVPRDLAELIPLFLETRQQDISGLFLGLASNDFESLRVIGHSMRGTGSSFGFDQISSMGAAIEDAALVRDAQTIKSQLVQFQTFLSCAEIKYV